MHRARRRFGMGILQRYFSLRSRKANPEGERRERALLLSQTVLQDCNAGRFADALAPANELIALLREVGSTTDESWARPGLGQILSDHARILRELRRPEEAIASVREAIRIWMSLAHGDPQHLRQLAMGLGILAEALHDIGRDDGAAEALRQAVRQYRGLLPADRGRFLPDLARCLSDLGVLETTLGRVDAGFEAAQEAVALYRELRSTDVARFRPLLAGALNNLGTAAQQPEHLEAGLAAMDEAVYLYRQILPVDREAAQPYFPAALINRALLLRDAGRGEEAVESLQEAVTVARAFAAQSPERQPDLAAALKALADALREAGSPEKSLAAIEEAILIWTDLAGRDPAQYTRALAEGLAFAAMRFIDMREPAPAARMAILSVEMGRALAAGDRDAHLPRVAESLVTLAHVFNCAGEWERALEPAAEAVSLWREIAESDPAQTMKCVVAEGLNALVLRRLERPAEAADLLLDALVRIRSEAREWVESDRSTVERLLADYGEACRAMGAEPDADAILPLADALAGG
jgi:tetratricopeptide (TPR) repeat protein